jgi:membrane-associated PAP2 superfamily phosphatase
MTMLPIHIIAGSIAIVAGFISVFAVKGLKLHRKSGIIFVYSMVVLSLTGAVIATLKHQTANIIGGSLAFYMATTALLTVRPRDRRTQWIDAGGFVAAATVGAAAVKIGLDALDSGTGKTNGVPAGMMFFFGAVALLAALGDVRMILIGGLQGAHRIARHLWRMCFSLFIASGSFFLGQAKVIPKSIRILPLLAIPALLPLVLMLFWLARVLLTKWYRRRADSWKPAM